MFYFKSRQVPSELYHEENEADAMYSVFSKKKKAKLPSWRLWGEEEIDGAIYTVYLKKVRYHPSTTVNSTNDDSISHLEWETVRVRVIKAGTLEKLVESLATDAGELESTYVNIFFSTYRSFATPQQILTLLLNRYELLGNKSPDIDDELREQHRSTLTKALLVWLDMYPEDFFEPPQFLALHQIIEFANRNLPGHILETRAVHRLEKFKRDGMYKDYFDKLDWCTRYSGNTILSGGMVPLSFLEKQEEHFACQLTSMDAELFKRLVPHHCLGSFWSKKDKSDSWNFIPNTVTATINQFNAVSFRVISTTLSDPSLKPAIRAKVIAKWIDIAQELRFLKNFSSLKAVTAALQSNPVYRLRKIWTHIPRVKVEAFTELARIFSGDNNQINCRELLFKEGAAKFATTFGENDRQLQKALQRQMSENESTMKGTVPYLGTFLTDLTMIDTAFPDILSNGLINFEKRRREFEILAQIKLLQSAANSYAIEPDNHFQAWFSSLPVLEDSESYELSCLIEPSENVTSEKKAFQKIKSSATKWGHRKNDSTSSTSTSSSSSQFYDHISSDLSVNSIAADSNCNFKMSKSSSSLSLPSLSSSNLPPDSVSKCPEFYIIKVSLEQPSNDAKGVNLYKSIMLSNRDRTRAVIANAMTKHGLSGDPENYTLSQVVPSGEIVFPSSANVYYAVNTSYELNFILRARQEDVNHGAKKGKPHLVRRFLNSAS